MPCDDTDSDFDFTIGQRYYIGNDTGTIRFVGYLHEIWGPHVLALGIEWDCPGRGNSDGSIDGKFYFHVKSSKSGSFIKARNKSLRRHRLSFCDGLVDRYADTTQFTTCLSFGLKTVQGTGFDKLNRLQSDFSSLRSVLLERQGIFVSSNADTDDLSLVSSKLVNLVHLDLGFNLFSSLHSIWEIVDTLPSLESLVLDGNRFNDFSLPPIKFHPLRILNLDDTALSIVHINQILEKFPNLHELLLAGNDLCDGDISSLVIPSSVRVLGLARNQLTVHPLLGKLPLKELDVSHNQITRCNRSDSGSIESLDLRHNAIDNWDFVDRLPEIYPMLKELRINHNPLFTDMLLEDMTVTLVGHLPCKTIRGVGNSLGIEKLNGGTFRGDVVENYELYFISKVGKGIWTKPLALRWSALLSKSGKAPIIATPSPASNGMKAKVVSLKLNANGVIHPRLLMGENTILRLRGIFSKLLHNVSILDLSLYYYIDDVGTVEKDNENKIFLQDAMARLCSFDFRPEHTIYCEVSSN